MSGGCQSIIKGHEKYDARIVNYRIEDKTTK